jgi:HlyD family secretion protein
MRRWHVMLLCAAALSAACTKPPAGLEASGTIEATSVRVSSRAAGVILSMAAAEGQSVTRGDLLAEIDHEALDLQLGQARAGVELARAQLGLLASGARPEDISQAQEAVTQANQAMRSAQSDSERTARLFAARAATSKERDDAEARLTSARAQAAAAEQALRKLENFARVDEVRAASARVQQAQFAARLLEKGIADCTVRSPLSGIVTEKLAEPGELAAPGTGLYVVTDLATVRLTIYVPETALARVRLGQRARIRIDSRPGRDFDGTVTWISSVAEFTPRDVQTREERVKLVFAVRIEMANPDGALKPGLPADAMLEEETRPDG